MIDDQIAQRTFHIKIEIGLIAFITTYTSTVAQLNMGLHAAEQLVTELAASRVGTDFETTEDQSELNIPSFLVYLFGIVIAEDDYQRWKDQNQQMQIDHGRTSYYFSPSREKRFFAFQKKYLAFATDASVRTGVEQQQQQQQQQQRIQTSSAQPSKSKPYKLTSRMFPSKDQQAIVTRDLLKECEKLESLSNEALEALLTEELLSSHQTATKNKRKAQKSGKLKSRQQPTTETKGNAIVAKDDGKEGNKTSILEEVETTTFPNPCVDRSMEMEARGENLCVEMKSTCDGEVQEESSLRSLLSDENKNALTSNRYIGPVILKTEFGNSIKKEDGLTLIKNNIGNNPISSDVADNSNEENDSLQANVTPLASPVENIGSFMNNLSSPAPSLLPNNLLGLNTTTSDDHDARLRHSTIDASAALTQQTERITDLEHNLAEANRQLIGERLAHTKALRKEKVRYENLIRAMQLRLYISENKLRTYEDALEKHNQAVSAINNTSRSAAMTKNNNEERIPNSPSLISKVIKNQSDRKAGDPMWLKKKNYNFESLS